MRAFETHAAGGELVNMRGFDLRDSVAAKFGAQVVDGDESHVGPYGTFGGGEQDYGQDEMFEKHEVMVGWVDSSGLLLGMTSEQ